MCAFNIIKKSDQPQTKIFLKSCSYTQSMKEQLNNLLGGAPGWLSHEASDWLRP